MFQHHSLRRSHLLPASIALIVSLRIDSAAHAAATTGTSTPVGSFVSGERPMYLEIDQLIEGAPFHAKFMNVPAGATDETLIISGHLFITKHPDASCPGFLGPDLLYATQIPVTGESCTAVLSPAMSGATIYVQGYMKTPAGGRLTSMVEAHPKVATANPPAPTITFPINLTTQEVRRTGKAGFDRVQQPVRVGLPMPKGAVVERNGVPQLTLAGGPAAGQFSTLATWSDGSCKWVLCEYLADVKAGLSDTSVKVDKGSGDFGGSNLASTSGSVTTIDTGAMKLTIDATKDDLVQSLLVSGRDAIAPSAGNRPHYWDDQDKEWTWHKSSVRTRRNGPVRAEVEVDGSFTRSTSSSDADRIYVRFYLEACKGQSTLRATVSLRDSSLQFPENLLFRGFTYRAQLNETSPFDLRMPTVAINGDTTALSSGTIGTAQDASFMQGFVKRRDYRLATDYNDHGHLGFVQRNGVDAFAIEGVSERIGSSYLTGSAATNFFSNEDEFCDPAFVEVTSAQSGRGLVFGVEHACRSWPVGLDVGGDGRIEVGILPHKKSTDAHLYPLSYASAETRSFYLAFESARAASPLQVATAFDYPLAARADPSAYNQSDVWAWKLVSPADVKSYQNLAGIRGMKAQHNNPIRTVYRFAGNTGGANNNWEETRRFYDWLRTGSGDSYLNSYFEAMYKADQMAWNIDDGALKDRQKIRNATAPVTRKSDTYDGSKHMFMQAVPDWAFTHGETYLLDAAKPLAETILDKQISAHVQPGGSFLQNSYGAVTNCAMAVLALAPNQQLEDWLHLIMFQWANVVYQQPNNFGVNTSTFGWQAPVGTPEGTAANRDGFMISWAIGKSSDRATYGYVAQQWTDLRLASLAFQQFIHYLREKSPSDPLIADLLERAPDIYHYAHRGLLDDHDRNTGDYYLVDVFKGDAGNANASPSLPPGDFIAFPNPCGYAHQSVVNLLLECRPSESALSYGVELNRSMYDAVYTDMVSDPVLNDFIWRYLVHYRVIQP